MQKYYYVLRCANYTLNGGDARTLKQCIQDMTNTAQYELNEDLEELKRVCGMTFEIWKDKEVIKIGEIKNGEVIYNT